MKPLLKSLFTLQDISPVLDKNVLDERIINSVEQLRKALQSWMSIEGNLFWEEVSQWRKPT